MPMYFGCDVLRVGPARQGRIDLWLQHGDGAFPETVFTVHDPMRREILATALTAASTGQKVDVELDSIESGSVAYSLYLRTT